MEWNWEWSLITEWTLKWALTDSPLTSTWKLVSALLSWSGIVPLPWWVTTSTRYTPASPRAIASKFRHVVPTLELLNVVWIRLGARGTPSLYHVATMFWVALPWNSTASLSWTLPVMVWWAWGELIIVTGTEREREREEQRNHCDALVVSSVIKSNQLDI